MYHFSLESRLGERRSRLEYRKSAFARPRARLKRPARYIANLKNRSTALSPPMGSRFQRNPRNPRHTARDQHPKRNQPIPSSSNPSTANSARAERVRRTPTKRTRPNNDRRTTRTPHRSRSFRANSPLRSSNPHLANSTDRNYRPPRDETQAINRMSRDVVASTAGRSVFGRFPTEGISTAASILVRFGFDYFSELPPPVPTNARILWRAIGRNSALNPRRFFVGFSPSAIRSKKAEISIRRNLTKSNPSAIGGLPSGPFQLPLGRSGRLR